MLSYPFMHKYVSICSFNFSFSPFKYSFTRLFGFSRTIYSRPVKRPLPHYFGPGYTPPAASVYTDFCKLFKYFKQSILLWCLVFIQWLSTFPYCLQTLSLGRIRFASSSLSHIPSFFHLNVPSRTFGEFVIEFLLQIVGLTTTAERQIIPVKHESTLRGPSQPSVRHLGLAFLALVTVQ